MADSVKNVVINVKANTQGIEKLQSALDKVEKENKQLADSFKKSNKVLQDQSKKSAQAVAGLSNKMGALGGVIAGAFTIGAMVSFGKQILTTRAEFQKLEAVLTNTLGSKSKAQLALAEIQKFASQTPFAVVELTQAFVKLANQGFTPTSNEMRKLGDIASSTGKQFDQLAEAIIDAQTGEFERLKEFGIRAQKEGDKVTFTFKGVKTQTDFTNESIRAYILSLGDLAGVSGSMEAISKTLGGQISNLGDSWDTMLNQLGGQTEGVFSSAITLISNMVSAMGRWLTTSEQLQQSTFLITEAKRVDTLAESYKKMTEAGVSENDAKAILVKNTKELIKLAHNELTVQQKKLKELSSLSAFESTFILDIPGKKKQKEEFIATLKGEIEAYKATIKTIGQLKVAVKDGNDADQVRLDTIEELKLKIKTLSESQGGLIIGSKELTKNINDIEDAQQRLKNALNPVNRELLNQDVAMKSLNATMVENTQATKDAMEMPLPDDLDAYYKKLYGLEIDGRTPFEILQQEHDKIEKETKERTDRRNTALIDSAQLTSDTLFEIQANRMKAEFDYETTILKARFDANLISSEQFEFEQKKLAQQQYERTKRQAEFEIIINGAIAVAKTFATLGYPAGVVPAGIMAGSTLAQIAIVESQPVPKFEKGGLLDGKRHSQGGTLVEGEKGEFIINRGATAKNMDLINNINKGNTMKYISEQYIYPALNQQRMELIRDKSFADNIAHSLKLNGGMTDLNIVASLGRIDKSSRSNTDAIIGALRQQRKDIRNV